MITRNARTLQQYRVTGDEGRLVQISLGPGADEQGNIITRYADNYRGFRIQQYLWKGPGPAGRWFWQAQSETDRIGETVLYDGTEQEARKPIAYDAMSAIDRLLADPHWLRPADD